MPFNRIDSNITTNNMGTSYLLQRQHKRTMSELFKINYMNTDQIRKKITELSIGDSFNVESDSKEEVVKLTEESDKALKVIEITKNLFSIIHVEKKQSTFDIVESYVKKTGWFNKIIVPISLSHTRVLVKRINDRDNDCIKVQSSGKDVILSRDIKEVDVNSLTFDQKVLIKQEFDQFMSGESNVSNDGDEII